MAVPKSYRSIEEFEREELRPQYRVGFSLEDLMQETIFDGSDMLFDDTVDEYDPDGRRRRRRLTRAPERRCRTSLRPSRDRRRSRPRTRLGPRALLFCHGLPSRSLTARALASMLRASHASHRPAHLARRHGAPGRGPGRHRRSGGRQGVREPRAEGARQGFRPGKAPRNVLTHLYGPQVQNDVANAIVNDDAAEGAHREERHAGQPAAGRGGQGRRRASRSRTRRASRCSRTSSEVKYEGFELTRPPVDGRPTRWSTSSSSSSASATPRSKAPEPARPRRRATSSRSTSRSTSTARRSRTAAGRACSSSSARGRRSRSSTRRSSARTSATSRRRRSRSRDTHPRADFRGKKGDFHVTVTDLKERILPALDDEFAKDVGQFQTLVELRADMHTQLEKMHEGPAGDGARRADRREAERANPSTCRRRSSSSSAG